MKVKDRKDQPKLADALGEARSRADAGEYEQATRILVEQLIRLVGAEAAMHSVRELVLLEWPLKPVAFPVDPAKRLREVEQALADQLELRARLRETVEDD